MHRRYRPRSEHRQMLKHVAWGTELSYSNLHLLKSAEAGADEVEAAPGNSAPDPGTGETRKQEVLVASACSIEASKSETVSHRVCVESRSPYDGFCASYRT